jgi:spore coat-associated protein N
MDIKRYLTANPVQVKPGEREPHGAVVMKRIVGLILALTILVGTIGIQTFAYYTDTETSSSNQLVAGTLDLKTNNADGVTRTLYATSMSPGATVGPSTIILKNAGTTNGATMDIAFSYTDTESDGSPNTVPKDADETAAVLQVTTLTYGITDLLAMLTNTNSNTYIDVQDLTHATNVTILTGRSGLNAGATENFVISVRLRSETANGFQADGITITMTFTLKQ